MWHWEIPVIIKGSQITVAAVIMRHKKKTDSWNQVRKRHGTEEKYQEALFM